MNRERAQEIRTLYDSASRAEYEAQLERILGELRALLSHLPVKFQVLGRVKTFDGYLRKWMLLGGTEKTPIGDLLGVRVVCPFLDDLRLVERTLEEHLPISEVDRKAERQSFREFGYDSTHLILELNHDAIAHPLPGVAPICEIQLRTILQDAWAEVEHELIYKSDWSIPTNPIRRKLAALNANLTLSDLIFQELRDFQQDLQRERERRRELLESRTNLAVETESMLLRQKLGATIADDAERLQLDRLVLRSLTAHADGAFAYAIQLYSTLLGRSDSTPIRPLILNHRGMAYFALGESHAAMTDFHAALVLEESNSRAWYNLGIACAALGDQPGALEALARSYHLEPAFIDAGLQYSKALANADDLSKALHVLEEMALLHGESAALVELRDVISTKMTDRLP